MMSSTGLMETIKHRLTQVHAEIAVAAERSGRTPADVRLVAVTKTQPAAVVRAACQAGVAEIGENYLQEAEKKFEELQWPPAPATAPVLRHAIGHIQSNKVKLAVRWFDIIETVDSLPLAQRMNHVAEELGRVLPVLIQVNISTDKNKFGIIFSEVEGVLFATAKLPHIRVIGLMTIGRFETDPEAARADFSALRELRDELRCVMPPTICLDELSMGMSHDFPVAIEEGATIVRIGTRLFGARS